MQIPYESVRGDTSPTIGSADTGFSGERRQDQAGPSTLASHPTPGTSTDSGENSMTQLPSSTSSHDEWALDSREFNAKYWFAENGRISIKVKRHLDCLDDGILSQVSEEGPLSQQASRDDPPPYLETTDRGRLSDNTGIVLNVVMHAVGSVDEISHFIAVARLLGTEYGNRIRVRIATHPEFAAEIEQSGVEFFNIGAPAGALDYFMSGSGAKIPDPHTPVTEEDVPTRHSVVKSVVNRFWKACIEPNRGGRVFIADAIIANPQSLAHIHCSEKLGVPLHIMSTIPCTPTRNVAHPLVDVVSSEIGPQLTNRLSYSIVEVMIWRDIGSCLNEFRETTLGLYPMQLAYAPGLLNRLKCPTTYFRSPHIRFRPKDWPSHVQFYNGGPKAMMETPANLATTRNAEILFATQHFLTCIEERKLQCTILNDHMAAWKIKGVDASRVKLSAVVATVLRKQDLLNADSVTLFRAREYDLEDRPLDPMTSLAVNTYDTISSVLHGAAAGPREAYKKSQLETQTQNIPSRPKDKHETASDPYASVVTSAASGVGDIITASLKMPVTFTHGLAKGFHNVPRLYGDRTVRDEEKITGVKSGFAAAGKGLATGLYDGLTGFVLQPYDGAKKEGAKGFFKGFGKGLGGVVFKPAAGACGVPGYAFMGIYKEFQKAGKTSEADYVVAARIAQGEYEYSSLSDKDVRNIVESWQSLRASMNGNGG